MCAISKMERSLRTHLRKVTTRDKNPVAHYCYCSIKDNAMRFYRIDRGSNPRDSTSPKHYNDKTDSEAELNLLTKRKDA